MELSFLSDSNLREAWDITENTYIHFRDFKSDTPKLERHRVHMLDYYLNVLAGIHREMHRREMPDANVW